MGKGCRVLRGGKGERGWERGGVGGAEVGEERYEKGVR